MQTDSTICAISTPPGTGAIAVLRLSGKDSVQIIRSIFTLLSGKKISEIKPNEIHTGYISDGKSIIDQVVISYYKAPKSYTGEDIVEISCHGSHYIQQTILSLLVKNGAQIAQPGEFTLRAFLNNKLDLTQAESIADLIASQSETAHKLAIEQMKGGFSNEITALRQKLLEFVSLIELELDFSEEDVEFADRKKLTDLLNVIDKKVTDLTQSFSLGNVIKNGIPVVIAGPVNTGKSTLLNKLLNEEKAIVTDIPGTTRDFIEDTINIKGYLFRFIDTAGLRNTQDKVESIGISKSIDKLKQARIIIALTDKPEPMDDLLQQIEKNKNNDALVIPAINKIDIIPVETLKQISKDRLQISARNNMFINVLKDKLIKYAEMINSEAYNVVVTNVRHYEILHHVKESLDRIFEGFNNDLSSDLIAQDIREAIHYLGEITGEISNDEILGNIFQKFCIGK